MKTASANIVKMWDEQSNVILLNDLSNRNIQICKMCQICYGWKKCISRCKNFWSNWIHRGTYNVVEDCSKWSCDHNPAQRSWKVENRKWFGNWGIQRECSPKRPQREKFIKTWQGGQGKSKSEDKHHVQIIKNKEPFTD